MHKSTKNEKPDQYNINIGNINSWAQIQRSGVIHFKFYPPINVQIIDHVMTEIPARDITRVVQARK